MRITIVRIIFTYLKPLLFQSVVFIQLRLQVAKVLELLHKGVILLLQIFFNLLIFIHEGWSAILREEQHVTSTKIMLTERLVL